MAVTTQESTEYAQVYSTTPADRLATGQMTGKQRVARFTHDQDGAGDATSIVSLIKLPAGEVTLLLSESNAYCNWTTASATLDIGWAAYHDQDGTAVAADVDGILDGADVETAGVVALDADQLATAGVMTFNSQNGVTITASSTDVAIDDGDDLTGYFTYVVA